MNSIYEPHYSLTDDLFKHSTKHIRYINEGLYTMDSTYPSEIDVQTMFISMDVKVEGSLSGFRIKIIPELSEYLSDKCIGLPHILIHDELYDGYTHIIITLVPTSEYNTLDKMLTIFANAKKIVEKNNAKIIDCLWRTG